MHTSKLLQGILEGGPVDPRLRVRLFCEPTTAIAATAMAGGAITNIIGQNNARQVAKGNEAAKKNATDDQIMENRRRATHDYLRDVRLENLQATQETEAMNEKANDAAHVTADAKGTAVASAAERGVAGNSLDSILNDFDFQQNQEVGRLRVNQAMKDQQHQENIAASGDEFSARASAIQPYIPRIQPPVDYFTPIFGLGAGLAGGTKGLGSIMGSLKGPGFGAASSSPTVANDSYPA
jgi:hypothetical protein